MATEHFNDDELACRCGCGGLPPQEFQDHLEALRVALGLPMILSSAYRCPDHNAAVSKTGRTGPHTKGAVDVLAFGDLALELVAKAASMGWTGIGVNQRGPVRSRFIHIDRLPHAQGQPRPWIWSY